MYRNIFYVIINILLALSSNKCIICFRLYKQPLQHIFLLAKLDYSNLLYVLQLAKLDYNKYTICSVAAEFGS